MTTGPITSPIPIDLGTSLQKRDFEAGRGDGRSFADLLQVMAASGAGQDSPVSDSFASDGPVAVFERLDAAQIFNETGLFRGAAPLRAEGAAAADTSVAAAAAPPRISREAELQLSLSALPGAEPGAASAIPAPAADQLALAGGSVPTQGPVSGPRTHSGAAILTLRGHPALPPQGPIPPPRTSVGSEPVGPRSQALAVLVHAHLAKHGSTAALVSVQAVEGGLSLVVRAGRLSREERDKLRIEIGDLLASHGFDAVEIMLNDEAWPSPQGRDE